MTIVTAHFDDETKLERVINLFKELKIPFQFNEMTQNDLDEDDAELLDALIRLESLPDNEPYSFTKTKSILSELKTLD